VIEMNTDQLLQKLGSTQLNLSPSINDLMLRVRQVGLHKVAAQMHGVPEFTFKAAAQILGTQLMHHHLKFSKIASGIRALQALDQSGEITLEKTAGPPPIPLAALKGGARGLGKETSALLHDIHGMGTSPATTEALQSIRNIAPPPPKAGAGAAGELFAGPKGPSPFSGANPAAKPSPARPPLPPGKVDPNLELLMKNMGTDTRAALGKAFGVAPEAVTPAMYMRGAHGVPMEGASAARAAAKPVPGGQFHAQIASPSLIAEAKAIRGKAASFHPLNFTKMAQVFYAHA